MSLEPYCDNVPPMNRRDFLAAAGTVGVAPLVSVGAAAAQTPAPAPGSERTYWVSVMTRLADPVLKNLANGTLKARMPVEQAAGADRRAVSHLEALGRLVAGMAPWLELPSDGTPEAALRAEYADLARRSIARAVDPASPDFLNFTRERQPLVDAAFLAQGILRAPRAEFPRLSYSSSIRSSTTPVSSGLRPFRLVYRIPTFTFEPVHSVLLLLH